MVLVAEEKARWASIIQCSVSDLLCTDVRVRKWGLSVLVWQFLPAVTLMNMLAVLYKVDAQR
jgi:hypothetical protein